MLELITDAVKTHPLTTTVFGAIAGGVVQNWLMAEIRVALFGVILLGVPVLGLYINTHMPEEGDQMILFWLGWGSFVATVITPYVLRGKLPSLNKLR